MATTVVLTNVVRDPAPSTVVRAQFSDGFELEFTDLEHLRLTVTGYDTDQTLTRHLCLAYTLARSSDLSNVSTVRNKNFTFDLSSNNPIRVQ